jgi:DNA-directed RNA polymerase subunit K/omega
MSNRVELLTRVNSPEISRFLVCNLLARRVRQLANGQRVALLSGLIKVAVTEFLEGRLLFEVNGQRVNSSRDARTAETVENEKRSAPHATRVRGKGKLDAQVDHLEISWTVPVGR